MAKSFERNEVPDGYSIKEFSYMGSVATDQGDFHSSIGLADMIQFDMAEIVTCFGISFESCFASPGCK